MTPYGYLTLIACTQCYHARFNETLPQFVVARLINKGPITFQCKSPDLDYGIQQVDISNFDFSHPKNPERYCYVFKAKKPLNPE